MTYREIVKYVFEQEGQDFEAIPVTNRCRQRPLVVTRQICMSLGQWFLCLSNKEAAGFFKLDHATTNNAKIVIRNLRETDKAFDRRYSRYLTAIRQRMDIEQSIYEMARSKPGAIASRYFDNKTLQVEITEDGYRIISSQIINDQKKDRYINLTNEGMHAIIDCYCELHQLLLSKKLYSNAREKDFIDNPKRTE